MRLPCLALLLLLCAFAAPARTPVGSFGGWAAFCDAPHRCYAIAVPAEQSGTPFLTVVIAAAGPIVRARIGRPVRAARLLIDGMRYDLAADGDRAVADGQTSRHIIAAIRGGATLTMVATGSRGGTRRQHYPLAGAPSAIDAAIVAALR